MTLIIIRIFFILICAIVGYQAGLNIEPRFALIGGGVGLIASLVIITMEIGFKKVSTRGLSSTVFGLIFGLILAKLVTDAFVIFPKNEPFSSLLQVILSVIFCYLGMIIAIRGRDEFNLIIPYVKFKREQVTDTIIILDTSAIIDGRIADICQTKFIEGRFVIPRFVLKELHQIADSQDPLKRNRGRRGLDILNKIQKDAEIDLKIHEDDFPELSDVDAKIVKLAKVIGGKVFTTDYNLNKVAELQGVAVLNVNDLANSLKPVVLPGELMEVKLIKEGKEYNQAIGYLDDGTMIVVENSKNHIGQTVTVNVTSVLQTAAGRMIFAKMSGAR